MICDVKWIKTCHWTAYRRCSKCDVGGCYFDTQTHSNTDVEEQIIKYWCLSDKLSTQSFTQDMWLSVFFISQILQQKMTTKFKYRGTNYCWARWPICSWCWRKQLTERSLFWLGIRYTKSSKPHQSWMVGFWNYTVWKTFLRYKKEFIPTIQDFSLFVAVSQIPILILILRKYFPLYYHSA